jgi:hypothetical protein
MWHRHIESAAERIGAVTKSFFFLSQRLQRGVIKYFDGQDIAFAVEKLDLFRREKWYVHETPYSLEV